MEEPHIVSLHFCRSEVDLASGQCSCLVSSAPSLERAGGVGVSLSPGPAVYQPGTELYHHPLSSLPTLSILPAFPHSCIFRVSLGGDSMEKGLLGGHGALGLQVLPVLFFSPPAVPVQPPAADPVPVQDMSLLQQSPCLSRLPLPALSGSGGEPCQKD